MFDFKFDWNPELETGDTILDSQHKELFIITREIEQLILTDCKNTTCQDLLNLLCKIRDYITYHFYYEEQLLHSMAHPDVIEHLNDHKNFLTQINSIDCTSLCNNPTHSLKSIQYLIQTFVFEHLLILDMAVFKT